ncbi:polyketide cyclase [Chryseobacterium sp. T16E-39]|uniref:SRPBCC family protein n=1 Tax=Chryseobacterium sp. T16E-39 TaxID=2015076 RepID=UPI000B5B17DE|nr:SRPBCC family protein [Chryseobacterium sp. T16E-39]ASK29874.1 polyketide cyclase [Chryseobacterium sp. T16E-39]
MKILKWIMIALAAILIVWLAVAALISGDFKYEKSITINAPVEKIWQNTSTLKAMDQWSPWNQLDTGMKKDWSGTTGQAGEKMCWSSNNEKAGKGCQEIKKVDRINKRIDTSIRFMTPYDSEADTYVVVVADGSGSKVTWGFTSQIPYPFTVMKLFMNMDDAIGKDYDKGLLKLKELSEKP